MSAATSSDFAGTRDAAIPKGALRDPYRLGRGSGTGGDGSRGHGDGGPAPKRIVVAFGFWLFILSDIIMFGAFFATYAVLVDNTSGGPRGSDVFDMTNVTIETAALLASSFTCGLASIGLKEKNGRWFNLSMLATAALGILFLTVEIREFIGLVASGAGPSRSAFLSAFFTLVGCHGLHVTLGLLWLLIMVTQVQAKGYRDDIMRRSACFFLFWHALDIVWVGVLTVVYLMGLGR